MPSKRYNRRDLIEAYIDVQRHAKAAAEARDASMRRYYALSSAFGVLLEKPGDGPATPASWLAQHEAVIPFGPDIWADPNARWSLHHLFEWTVRAYRALDSPFNGFVDVPPAVLAMHSRHAKPIDAGIKQMREAYLVLLEDLVEAIWGTTADKTISANELGKHGWDPGGARRIRAV
jgi:hypothetical protein